MSDDRKYRFGWHPDQNLSSEPDLLGDDIPEMRERRKIERDTERRVRSMVHLHQATESAMRVTPVIGLFEDALRAVKSPAGESLAQSLTTLENALANSIGTNPRFGELDHCDAPTFRPEELVALTECLRSSKRLAEELSVIGVRRSLRRLDEAFDLIHLAQARTDSR
jgi:hypothetical protein